MATVSELTFAERVVLPFSALVPIAVGVLGYWVWKQPRLGPDERISERLRYWFVANAGGMLGLAIFHVLRHIMFVVDYRIGMTAFGVSFLFFFSLAMHLDVVKLDADSELLLTEGAVAAEYVAMSATALQQVGPEQERAGRNAPRRKYIAAMTYLVIVLQSGFDGLVLKYNPNAQSSATQVCMFFLTKGVESIVVSTALIHAAIKTSYYVLYMTNFTVTVALSTLSAYDLVPSAVVVGVFEHWLFQMGLGATGGLLLCLGLYFLHIEALRESAGRKWMACAVFAAIWSAAAATGMFG